MIEGMTSGSRFEIVDHDGFESQADWPREEMKDCLICSCWEEDMVVVG